MILSRVISLVVLLHFAAGAVHGQDLAEVRKQGISLKISIDRRIETQFTGLHVRKYALLPDSGIRMSYIEAVDQDSFCNVTEFDKYDRIRYDSSNWTIRHIGYVTISDVSYELDTSITLPRSLPYSGSRVRGWPTAQVRPDTIVNVVIKGKRDPALSDEGSYTDSTSTDSLHHVTVHLRFHRRELTLKDSTFWDANWKTLSKTVVEYKDNVPSYKRITVFDYSVPNHELSRTVNFKMNDTLSYSDEDLDIPRRCLTRNSWSRKSGYNLEAYCYDSTGPISSIIDGHNYTYVRTNTSDGKEYVLRTYKDGSLQREEIDRYSYDLYK